MILIRTNIIILKVSLSTFYVFTAKPLIRFSKIYNEDPLNLGEEHRATNFRGKFSSL